jgi:hypothetical protein
MWKALTNMDARLARVGDEVDTMFSVLTALTNIDWYAIVRVHEAIPVAFSNVYASTAWISNRLEQQQWQLDWLSGLVWSNNVMLHDLTNRP